MKQFPIGVVSFVLSAALNLSVLAGASRSFEVSSVQMQKQKIFAQMMQENSAINFNYVESPKNVVPPKLKINSSKISDKDSAAADLYRNKVKAGSTPLISTKGFTDQLSQRQAAAASALSIAKPEKEAKTPSEAVKAQPKNPIEEKSDDSSVVTRSARDDNKIEQKPQKKSEASQKVDGSKGQDKISTMETTRKPGAGANLFGMTSFEATGSGMGEYMKNLKEKIWLSWYPYLAFRHPMDFKTADAVLSLTLDSAGNLKDVHIVKYEGSETFAFFCLESVQRVKNFGKIPPEILALLGRDELEIKFAFHFK